MITSKESSMVKQLQTGHLIIKSRRLSLLESRFVLLIIIICAGYAISRIIIPIDDIVKRLPVNCKDVGESNIKYIGDIHLIN